MPHTVPYRHAPRLTREAGPLRQSAVGDLHFQPHGADYEANNDF